MTRSEAKAAGLKHYDEGRRPCPQGHLPTKRLVSTGLCVACARILGRQQARKDSVKRAAAAKAWRAKNPEKIKALNAKRDAMVMRAMARRWRVAHPYIPKPPKDPNRPCPRGHDPAPRHPVTGKCIFCAKEESLRYKAEKIAYRKAHTAEARARTKAWAQANPEKVAAHRAKYRIKHRERRCAYNVAYRKTHPKDPIVAVIREGKRRALKRTVGGSYTKADIQDIFRLQGGKCAYCRCHLSRFSIDHIMPISRGGSNDRSNLQLVCKPCNSSKYNKHPIAFAQSLGLLL